MNIFTLEHAKVLYLKFVVIYGDKFAKTYHDDNFRLLWANEWCSGLSGIDASIVYDAAEYCKKKHPWLPSVSEFRSVCEHYSGVPTLEQVIESATRREFKHPVSVIAYERVGSWAMKNDKEHDLKNKFKAAYAEAINQFRENTSNTWLKLEEFNQKNTKELPPPPKTPSTGESKAFRECMNKCQEILQGKKIIGGGKTYKQFDEKKIKKGHREFDQAVYNEWREDLLSIPETDIMILPPIYAYERMRFISQKEQPEWLRKQGYSPTPQGQDCEPPRRSGGPSRVYKNWVGD